MKTLMSLTTVMSLLAGGSLTAQEAGVQTATIQLAEGDAAESAPWLGLALGTINPPLRTQLGLDQDEGVLVADVLPDGPAAEAGLRLHDVVVKIGDTKVGSTSQLSEAVKANGVEPVALTFLRRGKKKSVEVTPVLRKAVAVTVSSKLREARLKDAVNQARARLWAIEADGGWKEVGPAVVVPKEPVDARDYAVRIYRQDAKPATITIERDGKKWTTKATDVDELPADVRVLVKPYLDKVKLAQPAAVLPGMRTLQFKPMQLVDQKGNDEVLDQIRDLRDLLVKQHAELEQRLEKLEQSDD